jgi:hypothetical protein
MNWFEVSPFSALGILITPICVVIGVISAGSGHGKYIAARLVLPFACGFLGDYFGAAVVISVLAFFQWPLYGFLIDKASRKLRTLVSILAIHTAFSCWLFTKGSEKFQ